MMSDAPVVLRIFERVACSHSLLPRDEKYLTFFRQIWSVVAGESAFFTKQQFYSAMRLISVAQVRGGRRFFDFNVRTVRAELRKVLGSKCSSVCASQRSGGKLEEREARSVLIGIGPPVPPPQMAGLEQLKTPVNQLAPKVLLTSWRGPMATASRRMRRCRHLPPPDASQHPKQMVREKSVRLHAGHVGCHPLQAQPLPCPLQAPQPAMPPAPKAAGSVVGTFPPMSADAVQRYQAQFAQLDNDHDGWVQVRSPMFVSKLGQTRH